jgi:hypothetical protein
MRNVFTLPKGQTNPLKSSSDPKSSEGKLASKRMLVGVALRLGKAWLSLGN